MLPPLLVPILFASVVAIVASYWLFSASYHKARANTALVITRRSGIDVSFTTAVALPLLHTVEQLDISLREISMALTGSASPRCRDDIRADIRVKFFVRVNPTVEDVRRAAQAIGCARASKTTDLEELLLTRFREAITTVTRRYEFEELYDRRQEFHDELVAAVGHGWNGTVLDHLSIDEVEQTPVAQLCSNNLLDAKAIQKITEITSAKAIAVSELERKWAKIDRTIQLEMVELQRTNVDVLEAFSRQTGRPLTQAQLDEQIQSRLRTLVEEAIDRRLPRAIA